MATALKELIVTYQANVKPALDALNQVDAKIKSTASQLKNVSNSFLTAGRDIGLSLSAPLALFAGKSLKAAAQFETLKMQMEVLTGSAEEGEKVFQRLVKFAAETPFELNELAKAQNTLMGFGETADQAYDHLRLIGDIAAVSGGDFQGISIAFGQVSASGRLMGQDLLQLVNNGVPIIKMLSDEMGVPKDRIKDLVSEGKVSFPILVKAFERATGKGGMFENGMGKLSKTLGGVYSTFKDSVNIALSKFGQEIVKTFNLTENVQRFANWIGKLADNFSRLYPETKRNIIIFIAFATALAPLLIGIGVLVRLLSFAVIGFRAVIVPIQFLIGLLPTLLGLLRGIMLVFAANPLTAFLAATIGIIYYWKEIVNLFKQAADWISKISISGIWDKVKDFAGEVKADLGFGAQQAVAAGAGGNVSNLTNQRTISNNLTVNIPQGMTANDATTLKSAIKQALYEENKNAYLEAGAQ